MSFTDAKKFCLSMDNQAHLVEIYSEEIQKFVETINVSSYHRFWIGATDQQNVSIKISNCGCKLATF